MRLDCLDLAVIEPFKKDALSIWFLNEGKASAIGVEMCVPLDEILKGEVQMFSDCGGLVVGDADVSRPPTAVATTLTLIVGGC